MGTSSLHYQGFKLWNDIPFALKSKPYKTFTKEFKKNLFFDHEKHSKIYLAKYSIVKQYK